MHIVAYLPPGPSPPRSGFDSPLKFLSIPSVPGNKAAGGSPPQFMMFQYIMCYIAQAQAPLTFRALKGAGPHF